MKLTLIVEAELQDEEVFNLDSLVSDLKGELMKVKSGTYENHFYGAIKNVEVERGERRT